MGQTRQRRQHFKSRKGCEQCKKRHKKCDETHPACGGCSRLDLECSFSQQHPSPQSMTSGGTPEPDIDIPRIYHVQDQELELGDLELYYTMIHYTVPSFRAWGAGGLPQKYASIGLSKPYLLHLLLAMAALHLFHKDSTREDLLPRATFLFNKGLGLVQPILKDIPEDHAVAVFLFAALTSRYAVAEASIAFNHGLEQREPLEDLLQCFRLGRGIFASGMQHWSFISESWLGYYMKQDESWRSEWPLIEKRFPVVPRLRAATDQLDSQYQKPTHQAIDVLFGFLYAFLKRNAEQDNFSPMTTWPSQLEQPFVELVVDRHPVAMVQIVYFAAFVHLQPQAWWSAGWPPRLLNYAKSFINDAWAEYIEWPTSIIMNDIEE